MDTDQKDAIITGFRSIGRLMKDAADAIESGEKHIIIPVMASDDEYKAGEVKQVPSFLFDGSRESILVLADQIIDQMTKAKKKLSTTEELARSAAQAELDAFGAHLTSDLYFAHNRLGTTVADKLSTDLTTRIAQVLDPGAFFGSEEQIHLHCSPVRVEVARRRAMEKAREIAVAITMKGVSEPAPAPQDTKTPIILAEPPAKGAAEFRAIDPFAGEPLEVIDWSFSPDGALHRVAIKLDDGSIVSVSHCDFTDGRRPVARRYRKTDASDRGKFLHCRCVIEPAPSPKASVQEPPRDLRQIGVDMAAAAEAALFKKINEGDMAAVMFYLKRNGGYKSAIAASQVKNPWGADFNVPYQQAIMKHDPALANRLMAEALSSR